MEVCLVNIIERLKNGAGWQIMTRKRTGFDHVFPGRLYTLDDAKKVCKDNNFQIVAIGDFWQCLK